MTSSGLAPAVVGAIDDLELVARLIVEGLRTGHHRSPFHGFSAEFSQYRAYRPGDDLKYLDWKLLARTDRLYTRQFRETTSLSAVLVIDSSASMFFPSDEGRLKPASTQDEERVVGAGFSRPDTDRKDRVGAGFSRPDRNSADISKFRYACIVAAALAYLTVTQGDSIGLMTEVDGKLVYLPARGGKPHLQAVLAQIARLRPSGEWRPARVISRAAELLSRRGVMFVLSDFYDAEDEAMRELKRAARRGHDVTVMQVVSRPEIEFPYRGDIEFEDLESGARRLVNAASFGPAYRAAVADFLARWRTRTRADGLDYVLMPTDVAPEQALRGYLVRRGSTPHSARDARG